MNAVGRHPKPNICPCAGGGARLAPRVPDRPSRARRNHRRNVHARPAATANGRNSPTVARGIPGPGLGPKRRLAALRTATDYDTVIVDCPASLEGGDVLSGVLAAADLVIIPVVPERAAIS